MLSPRGERVKREPLFVAYHGMAHPSSLRVMRARLRNGLVIAGVAGLYVLVARLGLAFDAVAGFASLVWPPTGIALASLLLLGLGAWPVIVAGVLTFFNGMRGLRSLATPFHDFDILLAVLIWAAMRFGPRASATASFVLATMAVTGTMLRYGPFAQDSLHLSLLSLQTFMALVASIFLVLSATVAEWRAAHQRALTEHEEAVQANLAKSEFLAVMSHELRTPLNAIAGYSALMKEGVYGALNEEQTDAVRRVLLNEQKLLALIDAVLGFVSAEKGEVTVQCENVRVADAFDAVEPLVKPELTEKHCVLARDRVGPALAVLADPKSLQRILVNFLSNATKYANELQVCTVRCVPRYECRYACWGHG